jgi:hypothetical protein
MFRITLGDVLDAVIVSVVACGGLFLLHLIFEIVWPATAEYPAVDYEVWEPHVPD